MARVHIGLACRRADIMLERIADCLVNRDPIRHLMGSLLSRKGRLRVAPASPIDVLSHGLLLRKGHPVNHV